jgi:hypothetical protein
LHIATFDVQSIYKEVVFTGGVSSETLLLGIYRRFFDLGRWKDPDRPQKGPAVEDRMRMEHAVEEKVLRVDG